MLKETEKKGYINIQEIGLDLNRTRETITQYKKNTDFPEGHRFLGQNKHYYKISEYKKWKRKNKFM